MKIFAVLVVMLLLFGCGSSKVLPSSGGEGTVVDGEVEGVVRVNYKGCGTLIEITGEKGEKLLLYPANLDTSLRADGLKIYFTFVPSRAALPSECSFANQTVAIDNVRKR